MDITVFFFNAPTSLSLSLSFSTYYNIYIQLTFILFN